METVHHIVVPVANASRSNPTGLAVSGHYVVRNGAVLICTEDGVPTEGSAKLDGNPHRVIAARLLKRQWVDAAESDFSRPLSHANIELQTRKWTDQSGAEKYSTEVVLQGFNSNLTCSTECSVQMGGR
jgi:hypothetical protein